MINPTYILYIHFSPCLHLPSFESIDDRKNLDKRSTIIFRDKCCVRTYSELMLLGNLLVALVSFISWRQCNCLVQQNQNFPSGQQFSRSTSFLHIDAESLSGLLSSRERYAHALNMTVDEVTHAQEKHSRASLELHKILQSDEASGVEKHTLMCRHRLKHGRHPFVCQECWSYNPVCLCGLVGEMKRHLPENVHEVFVWTHHREWGLTSNTGSLLSLTLQNTRMLMKGLPEHDKLLDETLQNDQFFPIVLWPESQENSEVQTIRLEDIPEARNHKKVILIAVDGTWRNARRMVTKLPKSVPRLDLPTDIVFSDLTIENTRTSILAPLRSKGVPQVEAAERQVCTAEAVTNALIHLGLPRQDGDRVLNITRTKVDLIRRYRGVRM